MRRIPEWQICRWDCVSGVHGMAPSSFTLNEIPPVEAVPWLSTVKDTVLIAHGLQHFLDDPVVCQSILNGILLWKSIGNCLVMVSPLPALPIQLQPFFHLIEIKLPDEEALMCLQTGIVETTNIRIHSKASKLATGLTGFQKLPSAYRW